MGPYYLLVSPLLFCSVSDPFCPGVLRSGFSVSLMMTLMKVAAGVGLQRAPAVAVVHEGVGVQKNHRVVVGDQTVPEPPNTLACHLQTTECSWGLVSCGMEGSGGGIFSLTRGAEETGGACEVADQGEPEEAPLMVEGREELAEEEVLATL